MSACRVIPPHPALSPQRGEREKGEGGFAILLVAVLLALVPGWGQAARGDGSSGGILARMPVGARSLALGGSHGTLPGTPEVLLVNPAALAMLDTPAVVAAYHQGVEDITYNGLLVATPVNSWLSFGAGVSTLSAGVIEAYDYTGKRFERDLEEDRLFTGAAAAHWGSVGFGVSYKFLSSLLLGEFESNVSMLDLGAGVRFDLGPGREPWMGTSPDWLYLGFSVNSLGDSFQYDSPTGGADPPPTQYRFGLSMAKTLRKRQQVLVAVAMDVPRSTARPEARGGVEINWPVRPLEVKTRAGIRFRRDAGTLSAGLGVLIYGVNVDYAYLAANEPFGATHHFSLGFSLGSLRRWGQGG